MLLLLLLIVCGSAEKSVLIIGGDNMVPTATAEQFFPSNMTTRNLSSFDLPEQIGMLTGFHTWVQATPINSTHAFLMPFHNNDAKSFFIDRQGHLAPGPVVGRRKEPGLTSIPGENGQTRPIYCGGEAWNGTGWSESNDCQVMSADGQRFTQHKSMIRKTYRSQLTAFGDELIAIGVRSSTATASGGTIVERYNGTEWEIRQPPPEKLTSGSAIVKLNENSLLACGDFLSHQKCFVYYVDQDLWEELSDMVTHAYGAEMVLIDQTVYAFGGKHGYHGLKDQGSSNVQTLDLTRGGLELAEWRVENVKLQTKRGVFGVWVIDLAGGMPGEPTTAVPQEPRTTSVPSTTTTVPLEASKSRSQKWSAAWIVFLIIFLSIVAYFVLGVLYRRSVVGARGIQQLPNHSFWLTIYRRAHHFYAIKFASSTLPGPIATETYHRFSDDGLHQPQQTLGAGGSQDVQLM